MNLQSQDIRQSIDLMAARGHPVFTPRDPNPQGQRVCARGWSTQGWGWWHGVSSQNFRCVHPVFRPSWLLALCPHLSCHLEFWLCCDSWCSLPSSKTTRHPEKTIPSRSCGFILSQINFTLRNYPTDLKYIMNEAFRNPVIQKKKLLNGSKMIFKLF